MTILKTLDPKECTVIITPVNGTIPSFPINGWSENDQLEYSQDEANYVKKVTVDGETIRVRTNNESGKITLKLDENSSVRALITTLIQLDKVSNKGAFTISINSPNEKILGTGAWFNKEADGSKGKQSNDRSYEIECSKLDVVGIGTIPL